MKRPLKSTEMMKIANALNLAACSRQLEEEEKNSKGDLRSGTSAKVCTIRLLSYSSRLSPQPGPPWCQSLTHCILQEIHHPLKISRRLFELGELAKHAISGTLF